MEEIVPHVFTWRWYSEPHGYDFNGHLLRHSDGNICIDPVQPSDPVLDELMRLGAARIVITNRNHSRAANLVKDRFGARLRFTPRMLLMPAAKGPISTMIWGSGKGLVLSKSSALPASRRARSRCSGATAGS